MHHCVVCQDVLMLQAIVGLCFIHAHDSETTPVNTPDNSINHPKLPPLSTARLIIAGNNFYKTRISKNCTGLNAHTLEKLQNPACFGIRLETGFERYSKRSLI